MNSMRRRACDRTPIVAGRVAAYLCYPRITWKCGSTRAKMVVLGTYALLSSYAITFALLRVS